MRCHEVRLFVKGNADLVDVVLSHRDGGALLDRGVPELVGTSSPGFGVEVNHEPSSGFGALRRELEDETTGMLAWRPDVVVLSVADDVRSLATQGVNPEQAVQRVRADLEAAIAMIKDRIGAHILVANASTIDPDDTVFSYHGLDEEPMTLRAHRLDLMLVLVSHDYGISVVDLDRLIAELGGADHVVAPLRYDVAAAAVIAAEIARILEDYGFFDDRPLLAQSGAKGGVG